MIDYLKKNILGNKFGIVIFNNYSMIDLKNQC